MEEQGRTREKTFQPANLPNPQSPTLISRIGAISVTLKENFSLYYSIQRRKTSETSLWQLRNFTKRGLKGSEEKSGIYRQILLSSFIVYT